MKRYQPYKFEEDFTITVEKLLEQNDAVPSKYFSRDFSFGLIIMFNKNRTSGSKITDYFSKEIFQNIVNKYLKSSNKAVMLDHIKDLQDSKRWSTKNEILEHIKKVILINEDGKIKEITNYSEANKKDLNELIGEWKAQYGDSVKQLKTDSEFKKLSFADKEYVIDEFNQEGRRD
jgi:hypothetical protein